MLRRIERYCKLERLVQHKNLRRCRGADHRRLLGFDAGNCDGADERFNWGLRDAGFSQTLLEAYTLGEAADKAGMDNSRTAQCSIDDREIERMGMGHDENDASRRRVRQYTNRLVD